MCEAWTIYHTEYGHFLATDWLKTKGGRQAMGSIFCIGYSMFVLVIEYIQGSWATKGSLTVWALYAYFSDYQNVVFELLVWCM